MELAVSRARLFPVILTGPVTAFMGKCRLVRTIQSAGDALFRQPTDAALHVRE
jgi:hypothetical protein